MWVDLGREQGNPRQLRVLADMLGMPDTTEAARLLTRLRRRPDVAPSALGDGHALSALGLDRGDRLRPRTLARAARWHGDPAALVTALASTRVIERTPTGLRLRARPPVDQADAPAVTNRRAARRATQGIPVADLWRAALHELTDLVNRANYDAFLADTAALHRTDDWLTIGVPSSYALAALSDRFRSAMEWALYVVSGERLRVRLVHAPPAGPLVHLAPTDAT